MANLDKKVKIIFTTSHKPSPKLRTFIKELAATIPFSIKINRGKKTLSMLYLEALELGAKNVIVALERKGNPSGLLLYRVLEKPLGLKKEVLIKIAGVSLWREIANAVKPYNPLSIAVLSSEDVMELAEALVKMFSATPVFSEDEAKGFDILVKIVIKRNINLVIFENPSTKKIVGPIIKVSGVKFW